MATPAILINIDVDDLDRAVAFYTKLLGVKVGRKFGAFGIELIGGSAPIYLLAKVAGTPASPSSDDRRRYERHWTPVHVTQSAAKFLAQDYGAKILDIGSGIYL